MLLPPATQWGIVKETAEVIRPAYEELICQAAQGEVLYNDDTAIKILALARASPRAVEVDEEASDSRPRKNSLFYKTANGAEVGDLFMSLIHTCELSHANPFDYLTEVQKHSVELAKNPAAWMPWNYHETLQHAVQARTPLRPRLELNASSLDHTAAAKTRRRKL